MILQYNEWTAKYGYEQLDSYIIDSELDDSDFFMTTDDEAEWLSSEFESYLSGYADYQYELARDRALWDE